MSEESAQVLLCQYRERLSRLELARLILIQVSQLHPEMIYGLRQRAMTALRAIADRFAGDSFKARALPPLDAPSLDKATAAGLRVSGGAGACSGACPVASCTIW